MATRQVNGVALYYEEHGGGQPILGIHGTGSSALLWQGAIPELARRGRLILYDRRGCTRSQRPEPYAATSIAVHADDAAELSRILGAAPSVIIGRSYGGEVAVALALRHPDVVEALVLLEPSMPLLSPQSREWLEGMRSELEIEPEAAGEILCRSVLGEETWNAFPEEVQQIFRDNGPAVLAELNGAWTDPDIEALSRLTQPTLLVSAYGSPPAFRAADDALAARLPGSRRVLVPGGHLVHPAGPAVLRFLDEIRPIPWLGPGRTGVG